MKKLNLISKIFLNIFVIIYGVTAVGSEIALANAGAITAFLGQSTQQIINDGESEAIIRNFSDYTSIKELQADANRVTSKVTEEGAVLLKNDNNALPLSGGAKVNLYSSSSVNYIYSGGGSSFAKKADFITLKEGLEKASLQVNGDLWNWYGENTSYFGDHTSNTSSDKATYTIKDAKWADITTDAKNNEAEAAIFVLSRYGTEATDLKFTGGSATDYSHGNYLELSPTEIDVLTNLKALKDSGKISKIIVLLNSVNQVECDYINDPAYGIDAVLWVGIGGTSGTEGIGKILSGEVSPSGKLTDTYWTSHHYNPVYSNFGSYDNSGEVLSTANGGKSNRYVVYQEGIYNGYRYTETRYEDIVLGNAGAGDFNYGDVVFYPFGYGLSYTSFKYSDFKVSVNEKNDTYEVSVTVTNDGSVAGKESVQIYLQQPYIKGGVEKAAVELVGYAKTALLQPGASETLTVEVDGRWFASYDAYGAKTYVLDAGNYYLTAATDAHNAINNILAAKAANGESVNTDKMVGKGDTSMVWSVHKDEDKTTYSVSKVTGNPITNQFDNADLNLYTAANGANSVTYVSRSNWEDTVKLGMNENHALLNNQVIVTVTPEMVEDGKKGSAKIQPDDVAYPTYGADNGLTLASLITIVDGVPQLVDFNDERWDSLLDQLTWEDTVMLLSNGLRKTFGVDSVGKPTTIDGNGALGPVGGTNYAYSDNENTATNRFAFLYGDPDMDSSPISYPCAALIAATMNDELAYELGKVIGEDCLWAGYSGIYGLGCNIHRGSYNGRAFEYYSEDPILSGYITANQVAGVRSEGVYVYMKHAILNEQEKNREGVNTWANEQTIRQIYARPFQIAIEEGGAENLMTGFNRIGVQWTSQHGFINNVFRDEFGMMGFAVSDYWQNGYMDLVGSILGGCALPDGDTANSAENSALYKYSEGYGNLAWAMREEAHRILYVVVNSVAMNGYSASTRFVTITPTWINLLNGAKMGVTVSFYMSVAFFAITTVIYEIKKRRA
ncbi:MAG: glycoside hydrolase family 3 C-terminal domain-containing protein [Clostridia bacterium]|nr:glycoside hydrolase family 3 C-terminal domain-containing protein [Clostridia bacterium]